MSIIIILLLALPIFSIGLIFAAKRLRSMPKLPLGLVLSGIAGAVFTTLFVFMRSTVPIAPYELSRDAWYPIYGQCLLSLYVGFGLGVVMAVIAVSPFLLFKTLRKKDIEES